MIAVVLTLLCAIVLTACNNKKPEINNDSEAFDRQTNTNNESEPTNSNEFGIKPINFEIASMCNFLPYSSFGVFNYNNKYGLINSDGNVVIEPIYDQLSSPAEDRLIAEKSDGKFYVLTTDGSEIGQIEYNNGELEINRITVLKDSTCNDGAGQFSDGLAFMHLKTSRESDVNSVCVDSKGNIVFESNLNLQGKFVNGIAIGVDNDTGNSYNIDIVAIDKSGKELWRKTTRNFGLNTAVTDVKIKDNIVVYQSPKTELWGAVDINGNEALDCSYEELTYAGNGKIGFKKYGLWGYIDYNGKVVIEPQFTKACDFRGGIALVCDDSGEQSFIDENGNIILSCGEKPIQYFENGIIVDNGSKILDSRGNVLYETDISQNGLGGTANGLSYSGGEIFYEFLRGDGVSNDSKTYNYFKLICN